MPTIEFQPIRLAILVLIAQWLERLTGDLKVVGSSPAWKLGKFLSKISRRTVSH